MYKAWNYVDNSSIILIRLSKVLRGGNKTWGHGNTTKDGIQWSGPGMVCCQVRKQGNDLENLPQFAFVSWLVQMGGKTWLAWHLLDTQKVSFRGRFLEETVIAHRSQRPQRPTMAERLDWAWLTPQTESRTRILRLMRQDEPKISILAQSGTALHKNVEQL